MNLSNFVAYVKQAWKNKPDTSTPLSAERLTHQEDGIKANSDAIQELAAAVVSQIVNNPDKIASMAALYAVDQKVAGLDGKIGDTSKLPAGTTDAVGAITQLYSNFTNLNTDKNKGVICEDNIGTLSSPSQLIHSGFYRFEHCSADVNSKLDPGKGGFTDYTIGDFHALLMSASNNSNGCAYGTLIVTSPRFSGKFWISIIWDYKFVNWYKFSGS